MSTYKALGRITSPLQYQATTVSTDIRSDQNSTATVTGMLQDHFPCQPTNQQHKATCVHVSLPASQYNCTMTVALRLSLCLAENGFRLGKIAGQTKCSKIVDCHSEVVGGGGWPRARKHKNLNQYHTE